MPYALGIDVGTTFTAAAVWRNDRVEVVALAAHLVSVPTVVATDGETWHFGDAAVSRAVSRPDSAAREFKRRLGDSAPVFMAGAPYSPEDLAGRFAKWVYDTVATQFGEPAGAVAVTHPANWTELQRGLFASGLERAGLRDVELITEPQAAAIDFATVARMDPGDLVLVYDLGGGTFDVALLQHEEHGFSHVGSPAGVERLGGIDFDEAVFRHALGFVPDEVMQRVDHDPAGRLAMAQLRARCVEAKEALSGAVAIDLPVLLPGWTSTVRVTRPELEAMIRPMVRQTVELSRQTLDRAGIVPDRLSAALLVGGSSRIPLVSELVRAGLDSAVRVDAHPKLVVARGAARLAGERLTTVPARPARPATAAGASATTPRSPRSRRFVAAVVAAVAVVVLGVVGVVVALVRSGGDGPRAIAVVERFDVELRDPQDVVAADGTAWVADDRGVHVVDLTGGQPVRLVEVEGGSAINLDATPDSIWITRPKGVDRLDRTSGQIEQQIELPFQPNDVLADGTRLWISDHLEGGLWTVDTSVPTPTAEIVLEPGVMTADLAMHDGGVWVTEDLIDQVVGTDGVGGEPRTLATPGCGPIGVGSDGDALWLACSTSRTIETLDTGDGARRRVTPDGASQIGQPWGLVLEGGGAWVTDHDTGFVSHVSADGEVQRIDLGEPLDGISAAASGVIVATTAGLVHVDLVAAS